MQQHTGAWQGVTYWAGGPWWGDYMFSIEPQNGVDKPQMTVLVGHLSSTDAVATGDLNGDGHSDIVGQHDNGAAAFWLMNATDATFVGAVGPFNPGPSSQVNVPAMGAVGPFNSWPSSHVKATGDFNGDGHSDIVGQHYNGAAALWLMDDTDATFVGAVGPLPDWHIIA